MAQNFSHLFSERAKGMRASEIRELLKLTQREEVISFAGGLPNPAAFPVREIRQIVCDLLDRDGAKTLQYGTTEGATELRTALSERLRAKRGISSTSKNVLITSGSQQGLDLISKVFLDPHDLIIVSAPTYLGGAGAFAAFQASMETVPLDDQGMIPELLEDKLLKLHRHGRNCKMIYLIPTFHNPAGVTMSEERRKRIIEIAVERDILIVEDDPYSELRFDGRDVKPIKAFDKDERVIYLGTFSKILAPGFRCAWLMANEEIHQKLVIAKQSTDLCTNTFGQYVAYEYVARGLVDKHIEIIKQMYKRKRDIMLKAMDEYFPDGVKWTRPEGGMFSWATLPPHIDTKVMFQRAVARNVAYVTGTAFYPYGKGGYNSMRLNFTHPSDEMVAEGIKRLAGVIREEMASRGDKAKPHPLEGVVPGV
ncbi:MAG: PLP-dependent aminotransferase family protein [Candidatus Thermoplasmatota archaeon]